MQSTNRVVAWFFGIAFLLSWAVWVPAMTSTLGWPGFQIPAYGLIGPLMPGIAAIIMSAVTGRWAGVRSLFRQLRVWRVDIRYYGVAVLLWPAIIIGVYAACSLWRGSPLPSSEFSLGALVFMLLIQTPNTLMEELGWRGFALPRMASTGGWLPASLLLGAIWTTWHLPYWATASNLRDYGLPFVLLLAVMVISGSVVFAWLYRNTGSLLLCWLLHLTTNTASAFLPLSDSQVGSLVPFALYTLLVLVVALFAGRSLAKAGRTVSATPAAALARSH